MNPTILGSGSYITLDQRLHAHALHEATLKTGRDQLHIALEGGLPGCRVYICPRRTACGQEFRVLHSWAQDWDYEEKGACDERKGVSQSYINLFLWALPLTACTRLRRGEPVC